jgi:hypothetical protein
VPVIAHRHVHSVDLKRKTAEVSSGRDAKGFPFAKAARKDSAVHVSLSFDSPVKQPGVLSPVSGKRRSRRSPHIRHGHTIMAGCSITAKQ